MLQPVSVGTKSLADYTHLAGRPLIQEIREVAEPLQGLRVLHLSATAFGGGGGDPLHADPADERRRHRRPVGGDAGPRGVLQRHQAPPQRAPGQPRLALRRGVDDLRALQRAERRRGVRRLGRDHRPRSPADRRPQARPGQVQDLDLAMPHRPVHAQPGRDRPHRAVRARLRRVGLARARVRAREPERGRRRGVHLPTRDRPALAEEHGPLPRGRGVRVRPVRHRCGPAAALPGVALRPVEGPDGGDRRLPHRQAGDARGAAGAGRLDGHRRPRGVGVLQLDDGLRRRRPGHPHPQQPQQRRRDRGERFPVAGRRGDPEVHARGLRADRLRGALEGAAVHRR